MVLILLFNTLASFLNSGVGQLTPPVEGNSWSYFTSVPVGNGTSVSPYRVTKPEELAWFCQNGNNARVELEANIDLGAHRWLGIPNNRISNFNGNGFTISNLTGSQGLFSNSGYATISNLTLSNVYINSTSSYVGAVAGQDSFSTISNVTISSGFLYGVEGIGGIIGKCAGVVQNCINNADIYGNTKIGGIIGLATQTSPNNCINTGHISGNSYVGGIVGCVDPIREVILQDNYSECTVIGNSKIGGICGGVEGIDSTGGHLKIITSGFKGNIVVTGTAPSQIGSIIGTNMLGYSSGVIINSFGIADIDIHNLTSDDCVNKLGSDGNSFISSYSFSRVITTKQVKEYRRYRVSTNEEKPFGEWAYHKNINGSFPFPKSFFAVGQFLDNDVLPYLLENDFTPLSLDIIKIGEERYVELGEYPQTYVGDTLNEALKDWFVSESPKSVGSYINGVGSDNVVHYVYLDGSTKYVRVASAATYNKYGYQFQGVENTIKNGSEYWFKIEPIMWQILNYDEVKLGGNAVLLSRQGLTSNIPWNNTNGNEWATSDIHTWLNDSFYNQAFANCKENIFTTTVQNNNSTSNEDGVGQETYDYVWLLSNSEITNKYSFLNEPTNLLISPTDYALVNACYLYKNSLYPTDFRPDGGTCSWWLRSAGATNVETGQVTAQFVNADTVLKSNPVFDKHTSIRPSVTIII